MKNQKKIIRCFLVSFFALLFLAGTAQQHNFKRYSVEHGIQAQVSCLLQDSRGYIWIGTENGGLNRFDGRTFVNYSKEDGIANLKINSICEDLKGNIWIATPSGLDCFNGKKFIHYGESSGICESEILIICKDKKGNLWMSTGDGLVRYDGKKFKCFQKKDGLSDTKVQYVFVDSKDNLWISFREDKKLHNVDKFDGRKFTKVFFNGFSDGESVLVSRFSEDRLGRVWASAWHWGLTKKVFVLNDNSFVPFDLYEKLRMNKVRYRKQYPVTNVLFDSKDQIWFSTADGIFRGELNLKAQGSSTLDMVQDKNIVEMKGLVIDVSGCSLEDANKNIWFGTSHGVTVYAGDMFLHYGESEGVQGGIFNITENQSNEVWINTKGPSWFAFSGDTSFVDIRSFLTIKEAKPSVTRSMYDSRGNLWFGTVNTGLVVYNGKEIITIGEKNGIKKVGGSYPSTIPGCEDKNGYFWFGFHDKKVFGCIHLDSLQNKVRHPKLPAENIDFTDLSALLVDKKGDIWFNTGRNGLGIITNGKVKWLTEKDGISDNTSGRFFEDSKGRVWFITWDGTLNVFENEKFRYFDRKNGFNGDEVFNIFEDSFGVIWIITTSEGVFRYDGKTFDQINTKDGLNDNTIWNILEDRKNNLWVGTNKGINKIVLDANREVREIKSYGYNEGFTGIECNQNSSFEDSKGNLWFGTPNGVTKYVPSEEFKSETAPILNINGVKLFYKDADWSVYNPKINSWTGLPDNMTLPYDQNHLTISFVGIDFRSPDKVRYKFILEGAEKKWSPVVEKNEVTYSNLRSGTYTFKVKSCNADGIWNEKPLSFSFTITPPWWRTIWFYSIAAVFLIALFYLFIKRREKKLQHEKTILEDKVEQRTKMLNEKTEKLEEAYKHITDSINYAKKIQQAILPPHELISASLKDYFIIYMPKDVVSGDYYAFFKKGDEIIIATADCTGHGVPGALMSMIGNEQLGKIVTEKGVVDPAKVLDELHSGIRKALKQDVAGGESRDGMDMALCKFNLKQNVLEYSGANRPLWLLRNNEILETRPDKFPIGGLELDTRKPFTNHTISLSSGDRIYTFTDGFADQFGGEKGKKFMLKNLEKLILSIGDLSMAQQAEKLKSDFEKWKGSNEQVDDVLVIGIQV